MTFNDANDPLLRALARLPAAAPDETRAARLRTRCHALLERARQRNDAGRPGSDLRSDPALCQFLIQRARNAFILSKSYEAPCSSGPVRCEMSSVPSWSSTKSHGYAMISP